MDFKWNPNRQTQIEHEELLEQRAQKELAKRGIVFQNPALARAYEKLEISLHSLTQARVHCDSSHIRKAREEVSFAMTHTKELDGSQS